MWKIKSTIKNVTSFTTNRSYLALVKNQHQLEVLELNSLDLVLSKKGDYAYGGLHFINKTLLWCDEDKESIAIDIDNGKLTIINDTLLYLTNDLSENEFGFFAKTITKDKKYFLGRYERKGNQILEVWKREIDVSHQYSNNNGALFLITKQSGELIKMNAKTGEEIWRKLIPLGEKEKFLFIYGIKGNKIFIWKKTNSIVAINTFTGEQEWVINNIPRPDDWHPNANIGFSNLKLSLDYGLLIGIKDRYQWIIDLEKGVAFPPKDYSSIFNEHKIFYQSSAFFTLDKSKIIFFDEFERNLISFNWKTEKVESNTSFPFQNEKPICSWQGPVIEGNYCMLLDHCGTLYIFER